MLKTSNRQIAVAAVGILAALIGSSACNHKGVTSGTAGMVVQIVPSPAGVGRYDSVSMDFAVADSNSGDAGLEFLPADPDRASVYTTPLSIGQQLTLHLETGEPTTIGTVGLAPGRYDVTYLRVIPPTMADNNPPNPAPRCIDNFSFLPSGLAVIDIPPFYTFTEADGLHFDVRSGQTKLQLRIDVPAFVAGYEDAFTCQDSCNGGGPCLTAFDAAAFRTALLNSMSFQ